MDFSFEKQKKVASAVEQISPPCSNWQSIKTKLRFISLILVRTSKGVPLMSTGFLYLTLSCVVMPANWHLRDTNQPHVSSKRVA